MTARVLLRFFKRLITSSSKKVFLILDNLRVHHAQLVWAWLEKHKQEIEVCYRHSYSSELSPDEELKGKVSGHMKMLQKKPERVKKYFKHPHIAYAA